MCCLCKREGGYNWQWMQLLNLFSGLALDVIMQLFRYIQPPLWGIPMVSKQLHTHTRTQSNFVKLLNKTLHCLNSCFTCVQISQMKWRDARSAFVAFIVLCSACNLFVLSLGGLYICISYFVAMSATRFYYHKYILAASAIALEPSA
jgi:hypothetical protein